MSILLSLEVSISLSFLITFILLMFCNIIIGYTISRVQINVLDWNCDPERYLKMLDNIEKRYRKKERIKNYLAINRAAAHIILGNYKIAVEYLEEVDKEKLSEKNGTYLVYTLNLITCLYELGEVEKAELLYENNMVRLAPFGKRLQTSVNILIGERYYYLQKYDLCYKHLKPMLNEDLSKRQYLSILFRLARIDLMNGATEQAYKKFKKIIKLGNKLRIVKESQEIISNIDAYRGSAE